MGNQYRREEREYGAPMGVQAPIEVGRPKVGPADAATRAKKLAEATKPTPAPPAPPPQVPPSSPTRDLSVEGAARKLRGRKQQIDDAVDGN